MSPQGFNRLSPNGLLRLQDEAARQSFLAVTECFLLNAKQKYYFLTSSPA